MTDIKDSGNILVGKKVLIIEDDTFLGGIVLRHMIEQKIDARLFPSGEGAMEEIKKYIPDIIVLDVFLPGINGLDILNQIRKDPSISKIPVLIVSNTDQPKDLERSKLLGSRFLIKAMATPVNIVEQLKEVLKGK